MRARIALFAVFSLIFGLLAAWILLAHYPLSGLKAELELASRENGDVRLQYGPGKEDYVQMSPQNTLSALAQTAQNELEITVLGEKHAAAQGAEVWLLSLFDGDGRSIPWQELRFEPGCDLAKGAPMCSGAPSAIRWRGKSKGLTLRLLQHPWSGKARVTVNGRSSVLDLYSPEHKSVVMFFGPRQWQAQLPALPITDLYLTFENGFRSLRLYRLSLVLWNRVIWSTTTQQFVKDAGKGEVSCGRGGCRIETPYSITLAAKGIRPFPISRARLVYGALFVVGIVLLLALLYCCGRYWFRNALIPAQCTRCDLYGSRTLAIASLCVLHLILSVFLVLRSPTSDLRSVMGVADTYLRTGIFAWGGDTPAKTLPMPILFTFGKDGYAHLAYEQGIPWLYAIMMAAGRAIDSLIKPAYPQWNAELAFVALPHLAILPLTGLLIFLLLTELGISFRTAAWASSAALLSTFATVMVAQDTRDGLTIPFAVGVLYFLMKALKAPPANSYALSLCAGIVAALACLFKLTSGLVIIPGFLYLALRSFEASDRRLRSAAALMAAFLLPVILALLYMAWDRYNVFGLFTPVPVTKTIARPRKIPFYEGLFGLLLSPGRGIIWYAPITLLALLALPRFFRKHPLETGFMAVHTIILLILISPLVFWAGHHGWGPRLLATLIPWLVILGATFYEEADLRGRILSWFLVVCGFLVQLPALVVATSSFYHFRDNTNTSQLPIDFLPSLSQFIVTWKMLLAVLTNGMFFGHSPIHSQSSELINFGVYLSWRETFVREVVQQRWQALPLFLLLASALFAAALIGLRLSLPRKSSTARGTAAVGTDKQ